MGRAFSQAQPLLVSGLETNSPAGTTLPSQRYVHSGGDELIDGVASAIHPPSSGL